MKKPGKLKICIWIVLSLIVVSGCVKTATKDDIKALQASVDVLLLQNHSLEKRVSDLEDRLNATPVPTATPDPYAQYTPAPTATPAPLYAMSADEICSDLLKAGLPISSFQRYTENNDPDQIMGTEKGYLSRVDFKDSEVTSARGILEVFPYGALASERVDELAELIRQNKLKSETVYRYDNVILRLPNAFDAAKCMAYEDALRKVLGLAG